MKHLLIISAALLLSVGGNPSAMAADESTGIIVSVKVHRTVTVPGIYSSFAEEFLGIDVPQMPDSRAEIVSVSMKMSSKPYSAVSGIQRTVRAQDNQSCGRQRSPEPVVADISDMRNQAAAAASEILKIRESRSDIVTGNTDANYTGEALGAAVRYFNDRERELMSFFVGREERIEQRGDFVIVPDKGEGDVKYIAFRLSNEDGLHDACDFTGDPVMLVIEPVSESEDTSVSDTLAVSAPVSIEVSDGRKGKVRHEVEQNVREVREFIPAVCDISLVTGRSTLLHIRGVLPQLGHENVYTVFE